MKEMMKQKMMNRFHKRNSSSSSSFDFKSGERLDFKFSSLQALQVPSGWDKLSVTLISVETDKAITKTGKASVYNGNCRWTETLSESIWVSQDDASKELQQCLYKFLISKGSTRSSILGEVTVNLSTYMSYETSLPVALPLKKCNHGTILQVAIQCLTPRANSRSSDTNSVSNSSDLDNMSDATDGVDTKTNNSIRDTSHARGLGSRETSLATGVSLSHRSFDSMEDSFGQENSHSNLSEAATDLIGRSESTASHSSALTTVNVYNSPSPRHSNFSLGSGKNLLNRRQESGKVSHTVPASPLRSFASSDYVLDTEEATKELRAEARTWERNARKLMVDLDLSKKETSNQTRKLENVSMELSALQTECNELKHEIKHLKVLLGESAAKERDTDNLKVQVQDKKDIQAELEEEIKFQKDLNNTLSLRLNKTQESNLELVSVLQELEETIEKQKLEIKSLMASEQYEENDIKDSHNEDPQTDLLTDVDLKDRCSRLELELQKFQESQEELESTMLYLEKTLEEKTQEIEHEKDLKTQTLSDLDSEWTKKLSLKDKEIFNLKVKLSEALATPVLNETESRTIETPDLIEEVKALKDKVLELERDCNELTDENLDLLFKLKESSKDLSTNGTCEVDYSLKDNDGKLENLIIKLKSRVEDLSEELMAKTSETEKLKSDFFQKEEEIQGATEKLMEECSELRQQKSELHNSCRNLEVKLEDSEDSFLKLLKNLEVLEENLSEMVHEITSKEKVFDSELDVLDLEFREQTEKYVSAESLWNEMYAKKVNEVEGLQQRVQHLSSQIAAEREKMALEAEEKLRLSEEKVDGIQVEYEKRISELRDEIEQFTEENSSLKDQLQKVPMLQDEIVALKNSVNDVNNENERLEASLQTISASFEQLKEEKSLLVEKVSSMEKAVVELEDHKRNMEEKLLRLEGDLAAREALGEQDAELKNEVGRLKWSNSQLQLEISHLQEEKDEYRKKVEALEEQKKGVKLDDNGDMKLSEDAEAGKVDESSRIQSLEIALAEALEANEMYKIQLNRFLSEKEDMLQVQDNKEHKLEAELNELQERYLNMSLKYAEVEAQREDLVLKLKAAGPGRSWFS